MNLFIHLTIFVVVMFATMFVLDQKRDKTMLCLEKCNVLSDRIIALLLFFATVCIEGIQILYRSQPFIADEVYTMSGGMFFAGYDVSSYMSHYKLYNFGYTMLLSPLYRFIENPVVLYRCTLLCNVILHGITIVIIYKLLRVCFGYDNVKSVLMALVSGCSFLVLQFGMYVYNETPLVFLVWVVFALLIVIIDKKGWTQALLSIVIAVFTGYAYIIHSRCIVFFAVVALVVLLYLLVYRKWLVNPIAFGIPFAGMIFGAKKLVDYVQVHLYLKGLNEDMGNSVEAVAGATSRYKVFMSLEGIGKLIKQFFSLATSLNIVTGGFILLATIFSLYQLGRICKKSQLTANKKLFVAGVFSIVSFWGMVACIAVSGAASGILRFLAYIRYFTPFIGPFLLFAMISLLKNMNCIKRTTLYTWSALGNVIAVLVFVFYSYPLLQGSSMKQNGTTYFFMAFARYKEQVLFSKGVIAIALATMLAGTVVFLILFHKKRYLYMAIAFLGFSMLLIHQVEIRQNRPAAERKYKLNDATWKLIKEDVLPEDIQIYYGDENRYSQVTMTTLFAEEPYYLPDKNAVSDLSEAVLLTNEPEDYMYCEDSYVFKVDKHEYIITQSEEVKDILDDKCELVEIEVEIP